MIKKNEELTYEEVLNLLGLSELDFLNQHRKSNVKNEELTDEEVLNLLGLSELDFLK